MLKSIKMKINGIPVRSPLVGGVTMKREKVWSQNTGRTAAGTMQGTIIAIKTTLSIAWPPLTKCELDRIEHLISDPERPFSTVEIDMPEGQPIQLECYFGTPSYTLWSYIGGQWKCMDAKVDAIER